MGRRGGSRQAGGEAVRPYFSSEAVKPSVQKYIKLELEHLHPPIHTLPLHAHLIRAEVLSTSAHSRTYFDGLDD
jgi:hypothetical protein